MRTGYRHNMLRKIVHSKFSSPISSESVFSIPIFAKLHTVPCKLGYVVAQLVDALATSQKVAGSIPDGVIGIFH